MAVQCQLASFYSQVRGIKFYDVSANSTSVGTRLTFHLEPSNPRDGDCIAVWMRSPRAAMLGHLAREAACHLAPLLRSGLVVTG